MAVSRLPTEEFDVGADAFKSIGNIGVETGYDVTLALLSSLNVGQAAVENRMHLDDYGGQHCLATNLGVDPKCGLRRDQVLKHRQKFGANRFPDSPIDSYWDLLYEALSDTTLVVLSISAIISLVIGIYQDPVIGWVEGAAILIAVFAVSTITAGNDYNKQLQFRDLEKSSAKDEQCSIVREETIDRYPVSDLVVGDILVLQTGDAVPADCIIMDNNQVVTNEASLTGEGDDLKKSYMEDCFLLSSCLIVEGDDCRAMVIAVGKHSQWGKIKENLRVTVTNTPLQDKLEEMTKQVRPTIPTSPHVSSISPNCLTKPTPPHPTLPLQIGYVGMVFALITFIAMVVNIWVHDGGQNVASGFIKAFIMGVTIIVVAIPEGLPLAVTIALAFSTKKMYADQCFIRVLAACETMGNATNICSDKTGTLTENSMTVVEGWFSNDLITEKDKIAGTDSLIHDSIRRLLAENISINRTAFLSFVGKDGESLSVPTVIGSKTEGALLLMMHSWKIDYDDVKGTIFDEVRDQLYSFNSIKKRSSVVITRPDRSVRVYCKGASETLLDECSMYTTRTGTVMPMTEEKYLELRGVIDVMASRALRTLILAHKDFKSAEDLEPNWRANPPDIGEYCVDAIVGIMDPLRGDVSDAVKTAQEAGVFVRMVTGDNIATAMAIARKCGILTPGGLAIEGPVFRSMRPADLDIILPRLQVMARSSPDDKMLLVTRLNGHGVPKTQAQWETKIHGSYSRFDLKWEKDRDNVLPGHWEEWVATRPNGGHVVSVTGDGTNDAPALKAADVGLAMGITGTKVAQSAADIVILDDRFSSIVRAITWGRCVYDNIRKFLQFQLTVNIVALTLVFFAAVSGAQQPITAVQMLWVNLVMDTLGALALGTELPTPSLLRRKPYNRNANLVSRPMMRNICCQAALQLALCFFLMYGGPQFFDIRSGTFCLEYQTVSGVGSVWDITSNTLVSNGTAATLGKFDVTCASFAAYCPKMDIDCLEQTQTAKVGGNMRASSVGLPFSFHSLPDFSTDCLKCEVTDFTHGTIIFNTFIWCQIFNEYASRILADELNMFTGISKNRMFLYVSVVSVGMQIFIVEVTGSFMETSPLTLYQWLVTIALGALTLPMGALMRLIPVTENEDDFFNMDMSKDAGAVDAVGELIAEMGRLEASTNLAAATAAAATASNSRSQKVAREQDNAAMMAHVHDSKMAAFLPTSDKYVITSNGVVALANSVKSTVNTYAWTGSGVKSCGLKGFKRDQPSGPVDSATTATATAATTATASAEQPAAPAPAPSSSFNIEMDAPVSPRISVKSKKGDEKPGSAATPAAEP